MNDKPTEEEDKNNKEYAEGYARGRSGDLLRDFLESGYHDDDIEHSGYLKGEEDRGKYGYKSKDECGDGETKSESSGCFLTTACCTHMGLPDNCDELQALRKFRDTYMQKTEDRRNMVKEYYAFAPAIVKKLAARKDSHQIYSRLYAGVKKIVSMINLGQNNKARIAYQNIYKTLLEL